MFHKPPDLPVSIAVSNNTFIGLSIKDLQVRKAFRILQ